MPRRVVITGLGPISGLGVGMDETWDSLRAGRSVLKPIEAFDPAGFDCQIASQVNGVSVKDYVPKNYRKAIKVMARDIELAVVAADLAARDASLTTRGTKTKTDPAAEDSYNPSRMGAHIGAGLIAAELNELTTALSKATDDQGGFDYRRWGNEGLTHLTPLWLLKYLPNMLACHVTIIHDAQGPSNTITCGEASGTLSIGESLRVIQRGAADLCFCGGAESKLNPMAYLRQQMLGRLNTTDNDQPETAVRPFCTTASGMVLGEAGSIVILEAMETYEQRQANGEPVRAYAEVLGFGASQSVHRESRNLQPEPDGRGIALAIQAAMREAQIDPGQIDVIVPFGSGLPAHDKAEATALHTAFGNTLASVPVASNKSMVGNCGVASGSLDVCVACRAIVDQTLPAVINCDSPLEGLRAGTAPSTSHHVEHVLIYSSGTGGQNAALVLKRIEE